MQPGHVLGNIVASVALFIEQSSIQGNMLPQRIEESYFHLAYCLVCFACTCRNRENSDNSRKQCLYM